MSQDIAHGQEVMAKGASGPSHPADKEQVVDDDSMEAFDVTKLESLPNEIKIKILSYLDIQEIVLVTEADPALRDVAVAILARGGHVLSISPNWLAESPSLKTDLYNNEGQSLDYYEVWMRRFDQPHFPKANHMEAMDCRQSAYPWCIWWDRFDLTEILPGGLLERVCQVADVAIEVAMELPWDTVAEATVAAEVQTESDRLGLHRRKAIMWLPRPKTLSLAVRPEDRHLWISCFCIAYKYKERTELRTSSDVSLVIRRKANKEDHRT